MKTKLQEFLKTVLERGLSIATYILQRKAAITENIPTISKRLAPFVLGVAIFTGETIIGCATLGSTPRAIKRFIPISLLNL